MSAEPVHGIDHELKQLAIGAGGAAAGAVIGTVIFPGVGTAIGAALGAVAGMFVGDGELDEVLGGAAVGAGVGAGIGVYMDKQQAELEKIEEVDVERIDEETLRVNFESDILFAVDSAVIVVYGVRCSMENLQSGYHRRPASTAVEAADPSQTRYPHLYWS